MPVNIRFIAGFATTIALALVVQPVRAYDYFVTDLGALAGPQSAAFAVNASGQVAGFSTVASANYHAIRYDGALSDLGVLPGDTQSMAFAINSAGQVVGVSYNFGDLQTHAVLWQGGVPQSLGSFSPRDVNEAGSVVGSLATFQSELWVEHACVWSGGVLTDLGTLGGANSQAMAVDSAGRAVGQSFLSDNRTLRACLWIGATPHDLGTLTAGGTARSAAADINDAGLVVGWSDTAGGVAHAFMALVDAGGSVLQRIDLGALSGSHSYAFGVNAAGRVVGTSNSRAILWQDGQMVDLNTRVPPGANWMLCKAMSINASGQIVGEGYVGGFPHGFLLTPIDCYAKGDANGDGQVDGDDIAGFVGLLSAGGPLSPSFCAADLDENGAVNAADVPIFVDTLLGL